MSKVVYRYNHFRVWKVFNLQCWNSTRRIPYDKAWKQWRQISLLDLSQIMPSIQGKVLCHLFSKIKKQFKSKSLWYSLATSLVELRSWIFVPREYEHHIARKINFFFEITCNPLFMNFQEIYFSWVSSLLTLEIGLTVSLLVTCFSSGHCLERNIRKPHPWNGILFVPDFSLSTMCNRSSLQTNILNLLCVFFYIKWF